MSKILQEVVKSTQSHEYINVCRRDALMIARLALGLRVDRDTVEGVDVLALQLLNQGQAQQQSLQSVPKYYNTPGRSAHALIQPEIESSVWQELNASLEAIPFVATDEMPMSPRLITRFSPEYEGKETSFSVSYATDGSSFGVELSLIQPNANNPFSVGRAHEYFYPTSVLSYESEESQLVCASLALLTKMNTPVA